ncbi:trehalose synthase [Clostridia bacterium]|nr:trehalose synthase [Clostridia bacterium]
MKILPNVKWYESAVFYELYTRSFRDGNGDGFGDFAGVLEKLNYLSKLGIDAIWFPPFYASPLRDGGYDISDYRAVDARYGTIDEFEEIVAQAHALGMHVMMDLVLNHTSEKHAWFEASRRNPKGPYGDYYVWADDNKGYAGTRIIFSQTEPSNWTYDETRGQYYWHRFYKEQPDLNFDCPAVHDEVLAIADFWAEKGVDGFRLDAIPFLYEREGTNNESLPQTHAFLVKLRKHLDTHYTDVPLLAEATTPIAENLKYFGTADAPECNMCFNFPLMTEFYAALKTKDARPFVRTAQAVFGNLPPGAVWSNFLRNHDFLTLELLTPEDAEKMEQWYAPSEGVRNGGIARRLAPLLDFDERALRALTALLLALPGSPCLYYGDEILMKDDPSLSDRDSVRLPLPWDEADRAVADPDSFWNWLSSTLHARREAPALVTGDFEILPIDTDKPEILRFRRTAQNGGAAAIFKINFKSLEFGWEKVHL